MDIKTSSVYKTTDIAFGKHLYSTDVHFFPLFPCVCNGWPMIHTLFYNILPATNISNDYDAYGWLDYVQCNETDQHSVNKSRCSNNINFIDSEHCLLSTAVVVPRTVPMPYEYFGIFNMKVISISGYCSNSCIISASVIFIHCYSLYQLLPHCSSVFKNQIV